MRSIDRLVAGYGKSEIVPGFGLQIARGQSLCLIGPNGAGKSTVLHSIYGFTNIVGGTITLGDTDVTRQLVSIIEAVRPGARFGGYVDAAHQVTGAPLIVCDLRIEGAKRLVREGKSEDVLVMPLPVSDYWSYWEFSKRVLHEIGFDGGSVTMRDGAFTDMLLSTKRAEIDKETGTLLETPDLYRSQNPEILVANKEKIRREIETLSDHSSRKAYNTIVTG